MISDLVVGVDTGKLAAFGREGTKKAGRLLGSFLVGVEGWDEDGLEVNRMEVLLE